MVDPVGFRKTKVDPWDVGELLLILQYIGEVRTIRFVSGKQRSIS